ICERNLDRFDATTTTWNHDTMRASALQALLFDCYRRFYSASRVVRNMVTHRPARSRSSSVLISFAVPFFTRFCAWQRVHPMSGGIGRVHLDRDADYRQLRRTRYQLDLVPLPKNLELTRTDAELNRGAKLML